MVGVLAKYSKLTEGRVKERDLPLSSQRGRKHFITWTEPQVEAKSPGRQQRKWAEGKDPEELTKVTQSGILEISGHIMFHWSLHDFELELWRGMWIFLLLLKIILSCHTQIYGKKICVWIQFFKKVMTHQLETTYSAASLPYPKLPCYGWGNRPHWRAPWNSGCLKSQFWSMKYN